MTVREVLSENPKLATAPHPPRALGPPLPRREGSAPAFEAETCPSPAPAPARPPPDLRPRRPPLSAVRPPPHNGRAPSHRAQGSRPRALPSPTRRLLRGSAPGAHSLRPAPPEAEEREARRALPAAVRPPFVRWRRRPPTEELLSLPQGHYFAEASALAARTAWRRQRRRRRA